MPATQRQFLIDTDTASDDAVAIVMALQHPAIRVEAITVVAGNVSLQRGLTNALYTVELCNTDVPVYAGADRPLLREAVDATWFHGGDGMGGQDYTPKQKKAETAHAVDVIVQTVAENPGIELVTLGPLTNIALALRQKPDLVENIRRCVVMGGAACTEGNVTPAAEYNIWCDPEAAQIVFRSGLIIEMVGWELSRGEANLDASDVAKLREMNTPLSHFTVDCNTRSIEANSEQSGEVGIPLPDPIAMAVAIDSTLCTNRTCHRVQVDTQSELTRGMTVVDRLDVWHDDRNKSAWAGTHPVDVCWAIDIPRWKAMLFDLVA